ncbi:uncharacterized protein LOC121390343 [Gigantopelta aegis]|uniref:uncharacterized protein LOC121390343 n=1 Tax=Gigantopelta aegis TaxID=1735272 RepID=UPI001B88D6D1|nr:uncharacterized protein LOC121390343 [Gigantopelta aegis]
MASKGGGRKKKEGPKDNVTTPLTSTAKARFGRTATRKARRHGGNAMSKPATGQARSSEQESGSVVGSSVNERENGDRYGRKFYERKMSRLVNHLTDTQKFYEEYVRLAQERDDEECRDKNSKGHVPVFNKRLFTSQGSVVITAEARRIMARNGRTRPDEHIQPLVKAELLAMRSVVAGLKMVHQEHDYIKKALCHCLTFESYGAHQFIVKRPHEDCLSCYYIVRGEVEVTYDIKVTETKRVYQPNIIYSHGSGEFLGLVSPDGLSEDISPPATIYTKEYCEFLRIDRTKFHKIIKEYDETFTEEKRIFFSRPTCVLSAMSSDAMEKILSKVNRQEYSSNREVMVQGQPSDYIYFVESGRCQLTRELYITEADKVVSCVLGDCEKYDYFGEECILDNTTGHCTVTPTCPTVILKMHKSALEIVPKDQLHNIIFKHRREFPSDDDLRERGYRKTVWNNYKHSEVQQTLRESGNMQFLSRKTTQRVRQRFPLAKEHFREDILEFISNGSRINCSRVQSAVLKKSRVGSSSIRPWTSLGISKRGEPDGQESTTRFEDEDDNTKDRIASPRTTFELPKTPERTTSKISREKMQRMLRDTDPEDLLHHMESGSELGKQLRQLLQDTHKPEHQNGFTKTSVLVTMSTEDIVRKAKAQAEQTKDRTTADDTGDNRDWFTVLHEENEKAKSNIVADKYRAAMLRRRLRVLDWKRRKMNYERTWRAVIPGDDLKPQKPKRYVLDELQEKYQGCSYNDASKKLGTLTFSTVFLCKALTARHRRTRSDESIQATTNEEDIGLQADTKTNHRPDRPRSAVAADSHDRDNLKISSRVKDQQDKSILTRERLKPPTINNFMLTSKS